MINGFHKCFAFVRKLDVKENLSDYLQAFNEFPSTAVVAALCKYLAFCRSLQKKKQYTQTCRACKNPLCSGAESFFFSRLDVWDSGAALAFLLNWGLFEHTWNTLRSLCYLTFWWIKTAKVKSELVNSAAHHSEGRAVPWLISKSHSPL